MVDPQQHELRRDGRRCPRCSSRQRFPQVILENFYQKSRNCIESGKKEPPYAFVIPAGQRDLTRVAFVVNTLRMQGIEVGRIKAGIEAERRQLSLPARW